MKERIIEFLEYSGGDYALIAFARHEQFKGDLIVMSPVNNNVIFADGVSMDFVDAMQSLRDEKVISWVSMHPWVARMDGVMPTIPPVRGRYNYKKPHWLPILVKLNK